MFLGKHMSSLDDKQRLVNAEIRRQYANQLNTDSLIDAKIGIVLGFAIVVLVQIITNTGVVTSVIQDAKSFANLLSAASLLFFIAGVSLVFASATLGVYALHVRTYRDVELKEYIRQLEAGVDKDYDTEIAEDLFRCYEQGYEISQTKSRYLELMIWVFFVGIVFLLLRFFLTVYHGFL